MPALALPSAVAYFTVTVPVAAGASETPPGIDPAASDADTSGTDNSGGAAGGTTVTLTTEAPTNTADDGMNLIVNAFDVVAFPLAAFTFTVNDFAPNMPLSQWRVPLASQ